MNRFAQKIPTGPAAQLANAVIAFGALGYVGYNSVFTVEGGHRAIVFNRFKGIKDRTYSEGMVSGGDVKVKVRVNIWGEDVVVC